MNASPDTCYPVGKAPSIHDSARGSPEPVVLDAFHRLVQDISTILGPSNGIDSTDVDVEELKKLMSSYRSHEQDWAKYAFADPTRGYTRNLISSINGKANLLLLVWTPGKGSPIHDHANAHCVMKILKGNLTETIYAWPCQDPANPTLCATAIDSAYPSTEHTCSHRRSDSAGSQDMGPTELAVTRETVYAADQVTYMSDRIGLHRIKNPSEGEFAVSLHLYTPPNAAKHGCHIFDERTGKKSHVAQCHFYSEFGVKMA